jgi:hypothetical protein
MTFEEIRTVVEDQLGLNLKEKKIQSSILKMMLGMKYHILNLKLSHG